MKCKVLGLGEIRDGEEGEEEEGQNREEGGVKERSFPGMFICL